MSLPLVLVESPAKASSILDALEQKVDILIIQTSPIETILSSPEQNGEDGEPFLFKAMPDAKEAIHKILSSLESEIYLAFDHDQIGEHWSWMISGFITSSTKGKNRPKRLYFNSLTGEGIRTGLANPSDNQCGDGLIFQTEFMFDRLLGDHLERLTGSRKGPKGLSLSFPTLALLFFITERKEEIKKFSPPNKGRIVAGLSGGNGEFEARLKTAGNITNDGLLKNKDEFKKVMNLLRGKKFIVKSVSRVTKLLPPPLPFNTLSLVQEAYFQLEMPPDKTLKLAKELFHGMKVCEQHQGLISFFLTSETDLPEYAPNVLKESMLKSKKEGAPGSYQPTNESDDIPIIPLFPHVAPEKVAEELSQEAADLYELIRNRALAGQMKEALVENIEVVIQAGDESTFSVSKTHVVEKGYLELYKSMIERDLTADSPIINLEEGDTVNVIKTFVKPTSGIPPEYYTLETIFSDLSEMGVRMDSMITNTLKEALQTGYIEINPQGTIHPLENCGKLVKTIDSVLPTMPGLSLSAYHRQTVEEVISGRKELSEALAQFHQILDMHGKPLKMAGTSEPEIKEKGRPQRSSAKTDTQRKQVLETVKDKDARKKPIIVGSAKRFNEAVAVDEFDIFSMKKRHSQKRSSLPQRETEEKLIIPESTESESSVKEPEAPAGLSDENGMISVMKEGGAQQKALHLEEEAEQKAQVPEEEKLTENENEGEIVAKEPAETTSLIEPTGKVEQNIGSAEDSTGEEAKAKDKIQAGEPLATEREKPEEYLFSRGTDSIEKITTEEETARKIGGEGDEEKYCPDCGRNMGLKEDIHGKYWECRGFPECRHTESFNKRALKMICPVCRMGEVITERTQIGKEFYVCSEKDCEFITWYRPHAIACPECGNPFLVDQKNARGRTMLKCPKAGCHYRQSPSGNPISANSPRTTPTKKIPGVRKVRVKGGGRGGKTARRIVRKVRVKAK